MNTNELITIALWYYVLSVFASSHRDAGFNIIYSYIIYGIKSSRTPKNKKRMMDVINNTTDLPIYADILSRLFGCSVMYRH